MLLQYYKSEIKGVTCIVYILQKQKPKEEERSKGDPRCIIKKINENGVWLFMRYSSRREINISAQKMVLVKMVFTKPSI